MSFSCVVLDLLGLGEYVLFPKYISRVNYHKEETNKDKDIICKNVSSIAVSWAVSSLDKLSVYLHILRTQNKSNYISLNEELTQRRKNNFGKLCCAKTMKI